jgi:GH24 family phage-related lysozyme (muramidase)
MYSDLTDAADCVRRLFSRWNQQKLNVQITQEQFDVLVSLVFNTGCSAMLNSDFIQSIKQKKYKEAAKKILSYRLKSGFSGLNVRRKKESIHFLKNL